MEELDAFLRRSGLMPAHSRGQWTALTGGVSSDIWRVDLEDGRTLCVKRALPKLKVAADWQAPVSRNAAEWKWISFAAGVLPGIVPEPLVHDEAAGLFAMSFLDPALYPVWKQELMAGRVDVAAARRVGLSLGLLHAASAHRPDLATLFEYAENFHALRLAPYLLATAERHPALRDALHRLAQRTAASGKAVIHGDVSPKNILLGPQGPVVLDAECACWGDPAFDLAFCLNHLLLKKLVHPEGAEALHDTFRALVSAYFEVVDFEPRSELEARAAQLLPALLLARVDGKSPVEYLQTEVQRQQVRDAAAPMLVRPPPVLAQVSDSWFSR